MSNIGEARTTNILDRIDISGFSRSIRPIEGITTAEIEGQISEADLFLLWSEMKKGPIAWNVFGERLDWLLSVGELRIMATPKRGTARVTIEFRGVEPA